MAKDKQEKNKKSFFKDFKAELKKVIWPTPKQLANSTTAVITIVLITAIIVFVLDIIFDIFNIKVLNKIKQSVRSQTVIEETIDNNVVNTVSQNTLQEGQNSENSNNIVE